MPDAVPQFGVSSDTELVTARIVRGTPGTIVRFFSVDIHRIKTVITDETNAGVMIAVEPTTLALEFGAGVVLGALLGFATKRVAKLLAVILGVELMLFRYLQSQGIVVVDWDRLSAGLVTTEGRTQQAHHTAVDVHWLESMLSVVSIGAGVTSGFLIGFYRG